MGSIDKIINNVIDIMEMGCSMLWSDLKRLMIKIIKVLNTRVKRVETGGVKNDKSSNGMNTSVKMVSEEEEAYARQMIKLKMMIREEEFQDFNSLDSKGINLAEGPLDESVFQDPMGLSKLTTSLSSSVKRDENGFPIDLKSKLRMSGKPMGENDKMDSKGIEDD